MFVAALTSAIIAGAVGTAQAAPDFKHTFEHTQNPTLVFPVMPKPAAGNFDNTYRIVNTEMPNKNGFAKTYLPNPEDRKKKRSTTPIKGGYCYSPRSPTARKSTPKKNLMAEK